MAKVKSIFECQSCGHKVSQWVGRCPQCQQWNSFEEQTSQTRSANLKSKGKKATPLEEVGQDHIFRTQSGLGEFDRVMGGGVALGSLTLLGGEPGIGKSTLLMQVLAKMLHSSGKIGLYISGEESEQQVGERARRMGVPKGGLFLLHETKWEEIVQVIKDSRPTFIVLDSIQTTVSQELGSPSGSLAQIREVTYELMNLAKADNITCFVIGHVTKEGQIAGPKVLEHMVDTVIYFEGDQFGHYRLLRAYKNRFGNTHEVGLFQMEEQGLLEVKNPSQFFVEEGREKSYGRALTCLMEGSRTLLVEVQALVVETKSANARRTPHGIDSNRLAMLVAVIEKYYDVPLGFCDIYVNVVGGLKIQSREVDLAIIAAILSSHYRTTLPDQTIYLGEVGLTGEVRPVPFLSRRLKELEQLQYTSLVLSNRSRGLFDIPKTFDLSEIARISELQFSD